MSNFSNNGKELKLGGRVEGKLEGKEVVSSWVGVPGSCSTLELLLGPVVEEGKGTGGKVGIVVGNDGAEEDSDTEGVDGVDGGLELDTLLNDL